MKFLKFTDKAAFEAAFAQYIVQGEDDVVHYPAYIGSVAVDVVGIIPVESGEFTEVDIGEGQTIQVPVMVDGEGFHVNLSGPVAEFAQYEVPQPATPYRVFAGWDAEPEPERVPHMVPRWAAVLALKSNYSKFLQDTTLWQAVIAVRDEIISKPDGDTISMGGVTVPITKELKDRVVAALDDANYWERPSEMVNLVAQAIGLTQEEVDALFIWAGKQQM